jgi:hypothetical protein
MATEPENESLIGEQAQSSTARSRSSSPIPRNAVEDSRSGSSPKPCATEELSSKTGPTDQIKPTEPKKSVEGRSQRASIRRWAFRSWIWELSACICSLLAFFSIFAVLKYYDGRPQPEWPYNITINSVLSWITTVLRAAMLVSVAACISQASWLHFRLEPRSLIDLVRYDAASRGPVGSVNLLWMLKAR